MVIRWGLGPHNRVTYSTICAGGCQLMGSYSAIRDERRSFSIKSGAGRLDTLPGAWSWGSFATVPKRRL